MDGDPFVNCLESEAAFGVKVKIVCHDRVKNLIALGSCLAANHRLFDWVKNYWDGGTSSSMYQLHLLYRRTPEISELGKCG